MRLLQKPFLSFLFLSLALFTLNGCGGGVKEFTDADFKKVTKEMTETQVEDLLGTPFDELQHNTRVGLDKYKWWRVGEKYYHIEFTEGKVRRIDGPIKERAYRFRKALIQSYKNSP